MNQKRFLIEEIYNTIRAQQTGPDRFIEVNGKFYTANEVDLTSGFHPRLGSKGVTRKPSREFYKVGAVTIHF